jgi:hypothetical protein
LKKHENYLFVKQSILSKLLKKLLFSVAAGWEALTGEESHEETNRGRAPQYQLTGEACGRQIWRFNPKVQL